MIRYMYSTTIVLPNQGKRKNSTILLNHKGEEMSTTVKPLFPYTWNGSWYACMRVCACVWEWKKVISRDANVDWLMIYL